MYFFDNLGGVLGGVLFTFVLIHFFSHFGILYFPAVLNLFSAALLAVFCAATISGRFGGDCHSRALFTASVYNLDDASCNLQFTGQTVVYHGSSPYGMLVVTEDAVNTISSKMGCRFFPRTMSSRSKRPCTMP